MNIQEQNNKITEYKANFRIKRANTFSTIPKVLVLRSPSVAATEPRVVPTATVLAVVKV